MFLLVPAHPGFPGQIPQSRKTVVCVVETCSTVKTAELRELLGLEPVRLMIKEVWTEVVWICVM